MRADHVLAVARREYLLRLKSKGYWLSTLGLPLFVLAATILPSLLLAKSRSSERIVIVDATGRLGAEIGRERATGKPAGESAPDRRSSPARLGRANRPAPPLDLRVVSATSDRAAQERELDGRVLAGELDAWVWVDDDALAHGTLTYRGRSTSNFVTQGTLERELSAAIGRVRLAEVGIGGERADELLRGVSLETVRVAKEGNRREVGLAGAAVAYIVFLMLFVAIQLWGQQVMTGVLEEKGTRIVEVLISAVQPFDLMLGKLLGIGALGLTQFAIWIGTAAVLTAAPVVTALAFLPEGVALPAIGIAAVAHLGLLFVLGFFVFASLYAALGAAFNDLREAQQMAAPVMILMMVPVFLAVQIINDPDSKLAVALSLVPLFSPLIMALRIALRMPPLWQLLLAELLTVLFVLAMVWACGRIYRVGILMYGKKPTFAELGRWIRRA